MSKLNIFTLFGILFLSSILLGSGTFVSNQTSILAQENEAEVEVDIEQENKCKKDTECENENEINNSLTITNITQAQQQEEQPEQTQLIVTKLVECESIGGEPNNLAVCSFAESSINFPSPEDFEITVIANNAQPSNFPGSSSGTPVEMDAGDYTVEETLANTGELQTELDATSIIITTAVDGDCIGNFNINNVFEDATGTIAEGETQECTLINTIKINGGEIPET